jgi:hypothetical protein
MCNVAFGMKAEAMLKFLDTLSERWCCLCVRDIQDKGRMGAKIFLDFVREVALILCIVSFGMETEATLTSF